MRAINLIPPDERRGGAGPARAGLLSYFVLGGLLAVLIGVTVLVLTGNQISDRKAEIGQLEQERDAAQARADSLRAFADFSEMEEARAATVTTLAQSRFDWERVLRELALVLPRDVWLTELEGSASPDVQLEESVDIETRSGAPGPALELVGCAVSQDAVASFAATLREIDGVTRVSVFKSELPDPSDVQSTAGGDDAGLQDDCRTRDFIARFEIVAAFDEAPVPAAPGTTAPAPTSPAPAPGEQSSETPPSGSSAEGTGSSQPASETTPGS
jgi:Tfp pilus assembly protein PilN